MAVKRGLILDASDNVANVLEDVLPGDVIELKFRNEAVVIEATDHIPFGFKVALTEIPPQAAIIKYGHQIGLASSHIGKGALVHIHNMAGARGRGDLKAKEYRKA